MKHFKYNFKTILLHFLFGISIVSCNQETNTKVKTEPKRQDTLQPADHSNPYAAYDQSPMDMSYYPPDYPILKMNGTDSGALLARVIYSRPKKKGRTVFGNDSRKNLREYGKEWRLGANEATEIEFFNDVTIAGKKISKGRYIMYCIPYPDKWTIVLNDNLYTWGLHMDASKDVFKTDVSVVRQLPALEDFTMIFEQINGQPNLIMAWDSVKVLLPFSRL